MIGDQCCGENMAAPCLHVLLNVKGSIDCLVQDCSNSSANALEFLQSCTKPSLYDPDATFL